MRTALQVVLYSVGLPLEALVIWSMVRSRAWKRYPFVCAYSVTLFAASLIEIGSKRGEWFPFLAGGSWAYYYWVNEAVLQVLMFVAVLSLIYLATESLANRTVIRRGLISGAVCFAVTSFALHYAPNVAGSPWSGKYWTTLVTRDLNLCTAILDLALWFLLLAFRRSDYRLLMLSGGLGIQFTGEAIGHSIRQISKSLVLFGGVLVPLANMACLFVWWQTFRKYKELPVKEASRVLTRPA